MSNQQTEDRGGPRGYDLGAQLIVENWNQNPNNVEGSNYVGDRITWRSRICETWKHPDTATSLAVAACEGGVLVLFHQVAGGYTLAGTTIEGGEAEKLAGVQRVGWVVATKNLLWDRRSIPRLIITHSPIAARPGDVAVWYDTIAGLASREAAEELGVLDIGNIEDAYNDAICGVELGPDDIRWLAWALKQANQEASTPKWRNNTTEE